MGNHALNESNCSYLFHMKQGNSLTPQLLFWSRGQNSNWLNESNLPNFLWMLCYQESCLGTLQDNEKYDLIIPNLGSLNEWSYILIIVDSRFQGYSTEIIMWLMLSTKSQCFGNMDFDIISWYTYFFIYCTNHLLYLTPPQAPNPSFGLRCAPGVSL